MEIKIKIIFPGSPVCIPCKKIKSVDKGRGKGSKGSKNINKTQTHTKSIKGIACTKHTLTNTEREIIKARNKRADKRAKRMVAKAAEEAEKASPVPKPVPAVHKTDPDIGKKPWKQLATKAA